MQAKHGQMDREVGDGEDRVDDGEQEQDQDTEACGEGDEDSVSHLMNG